MEKNIIQEKNIDLNSVNNQKTSNFTDTVNEIVGRVSNNETLEDIRNSYDSQALYAAQLSIDNNKLKNKLNQTSNEVSVLEQEKQFYADSLQNNYSMSLSMDERNRLDQLKMEDPDKWRDTLNRLEQDKKQLAKKEYEDIEKKIKEKVYSEIKENQIKVFEKENPELSINFEMLQEEVPPKYIKKYNEGEIDTKQLLEVAKTYITKKKKINVETKNMPNNKTINQNVENDYAEQTPSFLDQEMYLDKEKERQRQLHNYFYSLDFSDPRNHKF